MNITIKDIDDLKDHVGKSVASDVQTTLSPLVEKMKQALETVEGLKSQVESNCKDIKNLKANQAKALVGWTALCVGVTMLFNQVKSYVISHFHLT